MVPTLVSLRVELPLALFTMALSLPKVNKPASVTSNVPDVPLVKAPPLLMPVPLMVIGTDKELPCTSSAAPDITVTRPVPKWAELDPPKTVPAFKMPLATVVPPL